MRRRVVIYSITRTACRVDGGRGGSKRRLGGCVEEIKIGNAVKCTQAPAPGGKFGDLCHPRAPPSRKVHSGERKKNMWKSTYE